MLSAKLRQLASHSQTSVTVGLLMCMRDTGVATQSESREMVQYGNFGQVIPLLTISPCMHVHALGLENKKLWQFWVIWLFHSLLLVGRTLAGLGWSFLLTQVLTTCTVTTSAAAVDGLISLPFTGLSSHTAATKPVFSETWHSRLPFCYGFY